MQIASYLNPLPVPGATVQLRDADAGLCTVGFKLNGGIDVSCSLGSKGVPSPMSLDELGRRAIEKWLALEERLRLLVRQLLRQGSSLVSRQRGGTRCGASASEQRKCEKD